MKQYISSSTENQPSPCFCVGRQWVDGKLQPACPCGMRQEAMINVGTRGHIDHGEKPCLWDRFTEEEKKKPMMLSCNCPKCSPFC